jgi:hypothetical protein
MRPLTLKSTWLVVAGLLWVGAVTAGTVSLWRYENTPGTVAARPADSVARWPAGLSLTRQTERPTLVMVLHPRCPCSRASLGELERILARARQPLACYVLFVRPDGVPDDWEKTGLRAAASAIPGVEVRDDAGGADAKRLGASTSGHVLLFAADGTLRFSGGITATRGHAGDNAGSDAVLGVLGAPDESATQAGTAVFGCPLYGTCDLPSPKAPRRTSQADPS